MKIFLFLLFLIPTIGFTENSIELISENRDVLQVTAKTEELTLYDTRINTLKITNAPLFRLICIKCKIDHMEITNSSLYTSQFPANLKSLQLKRAHLYNSPIGATNYNVLTIDMFSTGIDITLSQAIDLGVKILGITNKTFLYNTEKGLCLNQKNEVGFNKEKTNECSYLQNDFKNDPRFVNKVYGLNLSKIDFFDIKNINSHQIFFKNLSHGFFENTNIDGLKIANSNLKGMNFMRLRLSNSFFNVNKLTDVKFVDTVISNSTFKDQSVTNINIKNAKFIDVAFIDNSINGGNIMNSFLQITNGSNSIISGTNISNSTFGRVGVIKFKNTKFKNVDLTRLNQEEILNMCQDNCKVDRETQFPKELNNSDLEGAGFVFI